MIAEILLAVGTITMLFLNKDKNKEKMAQLNEKYYWYYRPGR